MVVEGKKGLMRVPIEIQTLGSRTGIYPAKTFSKSEPDKQKEEASRAK